MTVPIHIPWDFYHGQLTVWSECVRVGVRRAVMLPRLDTIFSPMAEDPARERGGPAALDWRLVSPTEPEWDRYREMVEKHAGRVGLAWRFQRVENVARWVGGRQVAVPQYHVWIYRDVEVGSTIERLYDEADAQERRRLWGWLLGWTAPASNIEPFSSR